LFSSHNNFLINWKPFSGTNFLNNYFGRVRRKNISLAMIFELLFSHWNKERVIIKNLKTMEDKLGIGYTTRFTANLFVENETLCYRNQGIN
jgi:hypothetical protein